MTKRNLTALVILIAGVVVGSIFVTSGVWVLSSVSSLASALSKEGYISMIGMGVVVAAGFSSIILGLQCITTMIFVTRTLLKKRIDHI
jgi:hypothetical protein